jgi:hypothetical protein
MKEYTYIYYNKIRNINTKKVEQGYSVSLYFRLVFNILNVMGGLTFIYNLLRA